MVCDKDVETVFEEENVPILVEKERGPGFETLAGWAARVSLCGECKKRLGKPVQWIQDRLVNYAVFEGSDARVELRGAPCFNDD